MSLNSRFVFGTLHYISQQRRASTTAGVYLVLLKSTETPCQNQPGTFSTPLSKLGSSQPWGRIWQLPAMLQ